MFGPLGVWEIAFIMVLALLIFGPKKLPEVGRTIGRGMAEFRKATTDLKRTIEQEIDLDESSSSARVTRPASRIPSSTLQDSSSEKSAENEGRVETASSQVPTEDEPSSDATAPAGSEKDDDAKTEAVPEVKDALGS